MWTLDVDFSVEKTDSNSVVYFMSVALMIDATIHRSQHTVCNELLPPHGHTTRGLQSAVSLTETTLLLLREISGSKCVLTWGNQRHDFYSNIFHFEPQRIHLSPNEITTSTNKVVKVSNARNYYFDQNIDVPMHLLPDLKYTSKAKHIVILFCEFIGMGRGYILIYPPGDRPKGSSLGWGLWIIEKLGRSEWISSVKQFIKGRLCIIPQSIMNLMIYTFLLRSRLRMGFIRMNLSFL